jgi:hypothetical protein
MWKMFSLKQVVVLLIVPVAMITFDCSKQESFAPQAPQTPIAKASTFKALRKFSGKGDRKTVPVHISGNSVKLVGRTWGSLENTYSYIELKSSKDLSVNDNTLAIHTEGLQDGNGEIVIRNLKPGNYYISAMTKMNWEVVVYDGM